eukprot:TRINITY_DN9161_c0_g1_i1.p1 TRINITY_DN9161_c0_g1~~TRINITY_DN9161_c0_g1_i1.p1  ORF type:complete len:798 (+),score=245.10 TRINITY_DN9161_c0_g1_i1:1759-4152(+)
MPQVALSSDCSSHGTAPMERLLQRAMVKTHGADALVKRLRGGELHRVRRPNSGEVVRQGYPVPSPLVVKANRSALQVVMAKKTARVEEEQAAATGTPATKPPLSPPQPGPSPKSPKSPASNTALSPPAASPISVFEPTRGIWEDVAVTRALDHDYEAATEVASPPRRAAWDGGRPALLSANSADDRVEQREQFAQDLTLISEQIHEIQRPGRLQQALEKELGRTATAAKLGKIKSMIRPRTAPAVAQAALNVLTPHLASASPPARAASPKPPLPASPVETVGSPAGKAVGSPAGKAADVSFEECGLQVTARGLRTHGYVKKQVRKQMDYFRSEPDLVRRYDVVLRKKRREKTSRYTVNHIKANIDRAAAYHPDTADLDRTLKHVEANDHHSAVREEKHRLDDAYLAERDLRARAFEADAVSMARGRERCRQLTTFAVLAVSVTRLAAAHDAAERRHREEIMKAVHTLQTKFYPIFKEFVAVRRIRFGMEENQRQTAFQRQQERRLEERRSAAVALVVHVLTKAVSCFPMRARIARHLFMEKIRRLQKFARRLYVRKKFQYTLLDMQWKAEEGRQQQQRRSKEMQQLRSSLKFYQAEYEKHTKKKRGGGGAAAAAQQRGARPGRARGGFAAASPDPLAMSLIGVPPAWWTRDPKDFTFIATLTGMKAHLLPDSDLRQLATDIGYLRPAAVAAPSQRRAVLLSELHRRRKAYYRQVPPYKDRLRAWEQSQGLLHAPVDDSADGPDLIQRQLIQMAGATARPEPPRWSVLIPNAALAIWVRRAAAGEAPGEGGMGYDGDM